MSIIPGKYLIIAFLALVQMGAAVTVFAQSTDPNYPTPVETNEINGVIKARDIGDSRLTSFFYTFDGGQGDVFINVVSSNFAGDIDVFAADALRPLTKMVIYPEGGPSETGRLVYLRKSERLILRIEGRSPNDDPAIYRIKLGGSFVAITGRKVEEAPTVARTAQDEESGVRVNSVGTIVAVVPKPQPPKTVVAVEKKPEPAAAKAKEPVAKAKAPVKLPPPAEKKSTGSGVATVFGKKSAKSATAKRPPVKTPVKPKVTAKAGTRTAKAAKPPREEPKADPLASIRLVVQLKDGNVLERPMSEVLRFSVDKGVLTVIGKNGKVERYSILDVEKVTIQ